MRPKVSSYGLEGVDNLESYLMLILPRSCPCSFPSTRLQDHLENSCLLRIIPCPRNCGVTTEARASEAHYNDDCKLRFVECPDGCGSRVCISDVAYHKAEICKLRWVGCRWTGCMKKMRECDRAFHEEKLCKKRQIPCGQGCGLYFRLSTIEAHKANDCSHRFVKCTRDQCVKMVGNAIRISCTPASRDVSVGPSQ